MIPSPKITIKLNAKVKNLQSLTTELSTKVSGMSKTAKMEKEFKFGLMAVCMKATGRTTWLMGRGD